MPRCGSGSSNVVDLYYPPVSDEAPPSGSTAPTMLLQVTLPGSSQVYATAFAGTDVNLALLTQPINAQAPPHRRRPRPSSAPT